MVSYWISLRNLIKPSLVLILIVVDNGLVQWLVQVWVLIMLVLILIVVDNGLVLTIEAWMQGIAKVLILIVVDNGLVPRAVYKLAILKGCLNPYCSGQWSRTHLVLRYSLMRRVLILIVVDNGLVQY